MEEGHDAMGDFECNICMDIAQDPVITLCGHLHCWPCLYKWLQTHAPSHECPVCKAPIHEDKLIPLYGRGKTPTQDPRSRPLIPDRPVGQRPETAPDNLPNTVSGRRTVEVGENMGLVSDGFGGVWSIPIPGVGYLDPSGYGYGYPGSDSFGEGGVNRSENERGFDDGNFKRILVLVVSFLVFDFLIM